MTQRIDIRLLGLLALSAAFAAPAVLAQSATATGDRAQDATQSPTSPPTGTAPQANPAAAQPAAQPTWAELDTDKDGNLSKNEAAALSSVQALFDKADANADGSLTGDEYRNYLAMNNGSKGTQSKSQN